MGCPLNVKPAEFIDSLDQRNQIIKEKDGITGLSNWWILMPLPGKKYGTWIKKKIKSLVSDIVIGMPVDSQVKMSNLQTQVGLCPRTFTQEIIV